MKTAILSIEGRLVDGVDWLDSHRLKWVGHLVQGLVVALRSLRRRAS